MISSKSLLALLRYALPLTLLCLLACAPRAVDVSVYGEEFVEDGIPADAFIDGWAVDLTRFEVRIAELALEAGGEPVSDVEAEHVIDLAAASDGAGHPLAVLEARAAFENLAFRVASNDSNPALHVEGLATKGGVTKSFAWSFGGDTSYACSPLAAADPELSAAQITIHADHLFYDDLDSAEPNVAFDLIASADADDDGVVTQSELEATDISSEDRYQVGSRAIADLWRFIEAQTSTVGHIDGEGHCDTDR